MKTFLKGFALVGTLALVLGIGVAAAAGGYTLFGDATLVSPGNGSATAVQLTSSSHSGAGFGGIDFSVPSGLTFSGITNLATDYNFTHNSCGGGSPGSRSTSMARMPLRLHRPASELRRLSDERLDVEWQPGDTRRPADTSHLPGGGPYDTFAAADLRYGSDPVTGIQLVADASWFFTDGIQTVLIDNTQINGTTYTYEPPPTKNDCKNGGWKNMTDSNGQQFKNQGDCVSSFAAGGQQLGQSKVTRPVRPEARSPAALSGCSADGDGNSCRAGSAKERGEQGVGRSVEDFDLGAAARSGADDHSRPGAVAENAGRDRNATVEGRRESVERPEPSMSLVGERPHNRCRAGTRADDHVACCPSKRQPPRTRRRGN